MKGRDPLTGLKTQKSDASVCENERFLTGFSPRKQNLTLYIM